jgi:hypothetical protein
MTIFMCISMANVRKQDKPATNHAAMEATPQSNELTTELSSQPNYEVTSALRQEPKLSLSRMPIRKV